MRKLTAVLSILLILLLGFAAWFYLGGTLRCEVYIRTARAADYPEAFGAIAELVASGAAPQTFSRKAYLARRSGSRGAGPSRRRRPAAEVRRSGSKDGRREANVST